jgi:hypothetical protein
LEFYRTVYDVWLWSCRKRTQDPRKNQKWVSWNRGRSQQNKAEDLVPLNFILLLTKTQLVLLNDADVKIMTSHPPKLEREKIFLSFRPMRQPTKAFSFPSHVHFHLQKR